MHAFRIGKSCFHASMQSDFSLFMQIKLSFRVTSWCFCFCGFSRCMVTSLRNHLNFQNLFVWTNTNMISVFVLNFDFPKILMKTWGHACCFGKKGKTPKDSWCGGFISTKVCSVCYLREHKKRKHMILLTGKAHWTGKTLWNFEPNYRQKLEYVDKNKKFLQVWSRRGSFFFFWAGQELARHSAV